MSDLPSVDNASYPTPDESLAQTLNDVRFAYDKAGIAANVEPGSDHFIRSQAFTRRTSVAIGNNRLANRDSSPITAEGQALDDLASPFGITRRGASGAAGFVVVGVSGGGSVIIPADFRCTAPNGESYETITANTVSDGDSVEVSAVGTGTATNQDADTIVTWTSASLPTLLQTATVDVGGIDGGAEADTDEVLRQRLIRRLSFPAVGGTVAQVATFAEEASAAIEQAFGFAAVRGPGSYDVAIVGAGDDRELSPSIVALAESNITGNMPGHADVNVTSVTDELVDIIVDLSIPLPKSVGGAGGGWRDATPWPSDADAVIAKVTAKTATTITVNSTSADPPIPGKRFGIWDPSAGEMLEFTISTVSGSSGAYIVTPDPSISSTLTNVVTGLYISAGAIKLTTYGADLLAEVETLGPGEKTDRVGIIPRGRRQPSPDVERPYELTTLILSAVSDSNPEILDMSYAARYASGTTTALTAPSIPGSTADPPNILKLYSLAFRRKT